MANFVEISPVFIDLFSNIDKPQLSKAVFKLLPQKLRLKIEQLKINYAKADPNKYKAAFFACLSNATNDLGKDPLNMLYATLAMEEQALDFLSRKPEAGLLWLFQALRAVYRFDHEQRIKEIESKIEQARKEILQQILKSKTTESYKQSALLLLRSIVNDLVKAPTNAFTWLGRWMIPWDIFSITSRSVSINFHEALPPSILVEIRNKRLYSSKEKFIEFLGPILEEDTANIAKSCIVKCYFDGETFLTEFSTATNKDRILQVLFAELKKVFDFSLKLRREQEKLTLDKAFEKFNEELKNYPPKMRNELELIIEQFANDLTKRLFEDPKQFKY